MDARTSVFLTICMWVQHLAAYGSLSFFILENVAGICSKRKGENTFFADWMQSELLTLLPAGWSIRCVQHNSFFTGSPQWRPRVFFIGTSGALTATRRLRRICHKPPMKYLPVRLLDWIDLVPKPSDVASLTTRLEIGGWVGVEV